MGVHGLTTYMREHKRVLSKTVQFPVHDTLPTPLVVDAWSFIYELQYHPVLEHQWVYGGEYTDFTRLVETAVRMWLAVGFELHFVFDGPYPDVKFLTLTSRAAQSIIQPAQIFFRTSPAARTSPKSLRENRIIPPLMYSACLHALHELQKTVPSKVHIYHADQEGDPYAVSLAGKLGAYVAGRDSDFIVLNSEGYRGYIPLDEMVWTWAVSSTENGTNNGLHTDDDFGFQPVRKGKKKAASINVDLYRKSDVGLLPSEVPIVINTDSFVAPADLSLSAAIYTPANLAAELQLPVPLLPLVGALAGNDYTQMSASVNARSSPHHLFFEKSLAPSHRITHVATTLRTIRAAASSPHRRRGTKPIRNVIDLIDAAVRKLIMRDISMMGSGELEAIVNTIAEAALQYALPPLEPIASDLCELHAIAACPLVSTFTHGSPDGDGDDALRAEIRNQYITAYRAGRLSPRVLDVLSTGTMWPRLFLESPDLESTTRSVGGPLRTWVYALLDEALGVRGAGSEFDTAIGSTEGGSDDELIDVVEVQTPSDEEEEWDPDPKSPLATLDPLSALGPKLERLKSMGLLHSGDTPAASTRPASTAPRSPPTVSQLSTRSGPSVRTIIEHVRRGTRLAEEEVPIRSLAYLEQHSGWSWSETIDSTADVPLLLRDEEQRLHVFLRIMQADTARIRALPPKHLTAAVALRYLVRLFHTRAIDSGMRKEFDQERWTRSDARAFLASFTWHGTATPQSWPPLSTPQDGSPTTPIPVENRAVQLVAQASSALEALEHLIHVLLLATRVPSPVHMLSGRRFHMALAHAGSYTPEIPEELWAACEEGLENIFADERGKHGRRERKRAAAHAQEAPARVNVPRSKSGGGMFDLLSGMD